MREVVAKGCRAFLHGLAVALTHTERTARTAKEETNGLGFPRGSRQERRRRRIADRLLSSLADMQVLGAVLAGREPVRPEAAGEHREALVAWLCGRPEGDEMGRTLEAGFAGIRRLAATIP
jgi:hypothetical protein